MGEGQGGSLKEAKARANINALRAWYLYEQAGWEGGFPSRTEGGKGYIMGYVDPGECCFVDNRAQMWKTRIQSIISKTRDLYHYSEMAGQITCDRRLNLQNSARRKFCARITCISLGV